MTVRDALEEATSRLARAGVSDPRDEARYLLAHLLDIGRGVFVTRGDLVLTTDLSARYAAWIERRAQREPAQHITGVQEFHGLEFHVDRRALVPRPETELLVDAVLALELPQGAQVVDVGTGSGCIAITLARKQPGLTVVAVERSSGALALAHVNARQHGVEQRIEWIQADFRALPQPWCGRFAAVVSNPPYVSELDWSLLDPEVRDHDPREALVAGASGLEVYAALSPLAAGWLSPGGRLLLEIGFGQTAGVRALVESAGLEVLGVDPDLRGIPRVLSAARR